jgi:hypothetical protein
MAGLLLYVATVVISALIIVGAGLVLLGSPVANHRAVEKTCSKIKTGMNLFQVSAVLRGQDSYWEERADFTKHEVTFSGTDGTCRVEMDAGNIAASDGKFEKHSGPSFDTRAMD